MFIGRAAGVRVRGRQPDRDGHVASCPRSSETAQGQNHRAFARYSLRSMLGARMARKSCSEPSGFTECAPFISARGRETSHDRQFRRKAWRASCQRQGHRLAVLALRQRLKADALCRERMLESFNAPINHVYRDNQENAHYGDQQEFHVAAHFFCSIPGPLQNYHSFLIPEMNSRAREIGKRQITGIMVWTLPLCCHLSTPEEKCIGFPEQKCISEAGKKGQ